MAIWRWCTFRHRQVCEGPSSDLWPLWPWLSALSSLHDLTFDFIEALLSLKKDDQGRVWAHKMTNVHRWSKSKCAAAKCSLLYFGVRMRQVFQRCCVCSCRFYVLVWMIFFMIFLWQRISHRRAPFVFCYFTFILYTCNSLKSIKHEYGFNSICNLSLNQITSSSMLWILLQTGVSDSFVSHGNDWL